jgi:hypothetical protein
MKACKRLTLQSVQYMYRKVEGGVPSVAKIDIFCVPV